MDPNTSLSDPTSGPQPCTPLVSNVAVLIAAFVLLCLSAVILLLLNFFKQRVRLKPNCCYGYPGLTSPMDFLITPRHRWINVAILSVMGVTAINAYDALNSLGVSQNAYLGLFISLVVLPLLVVLIMVLQFAPLFACVDLSFTLLGHMIGLLYSALWFSLVVTTRVGIYLQTTTTCDGGVPTVSGGRFVVTLLQDIPYLVVSGIIVFWYLYQVIVGIVRIVRKIAGGGGANYGSYIKNCWKGSTPRFLDTCRDYHLNQVKGLLKKQENSKADLSRIKNVWNYLVPYDKYYRLPVPFLGAVGAILLILYNLSFRLGLFGFEVSLIGSLLYQKYAAPALNFTESQIAMLGPCLPLVLDIVQGALFGIPVVLALAPALAFISCLLILLHMIGSVSKMLKTTFREGFSENLPAELRRVPGSWKFVGNLIGFCAVAWLLYYIVFTVLGLAIGAFIIVLRIECPPQVRPWIISTIVGLGIPPIWATIVVYAQLLLCKLVFFSDREGKFISITNRNLFNWFSLMLFFYNGITGFVTALQRILISTVLGLLLLFRLDRVVVPKGFEFLDIGHKSYLGFFYLYYAYNNAVVHVFIKILKDSFCDNADAQLMHSPVDGEKYSLEGCSFPSKVYPRQNIRNRWLVAYTLIKNPSLQSLTGSNLKCLEDSESMMDENEIKEPIDSIFKDDDTLPLVENADL